MIEKCYLDEFTIEAFKSMTDRGHSVAYVAKRLDITPHSLYGSNSREHAELSEAQAKIRRLQKAFKRATEELTISKIKQLYFAKLSRNTGTVTSALAVSYS